MLYVIEYNPDLTISWYYSNAITQKSVDRKEMINFTIKQINSCLEKKVTILNL
jgi:hypothetical protein